MTSAESVRPVEDQVEVFTQRLESLYGEIEGWLQDTDLTTRRDQVNISERDIPEYPAPSLEIRDAPGTVLANLKPIGTRIIGARARVDLAGRFGSRSIVYLAPGGHAIHTSVRIGDHQVEQHSRPLFPGVEHEGWYGIDQLRLQAKPLNQAEFRDLLREVSDRAT